MNGRRRMDDGPWLYYKLTNEPKGSGVLIKLLTIFGELIHTYIMCVRAYICTRTHAHTHTHIHTWV